MTSTVSILQEQYNIAMIALEALRDDVMEPDKQTTFQIKAFIVEEGLKVKWAWRCYSNSKTFPIDENLAANVKAYCFDLIIMTRNL